MGGADRQYVDAVNILLHALPGTAIGYYGDELGMTDVPVKFSEGVDPVGLRAGEAKFAEYSRDFERTPMQWTNGTHAGFTTGDHTWLPVGPDFAKINVRSEFEERASHLHIIARIMAVKVFAKFRNNSKLTQLVVGAPNLDSIVAFARLEPQVDPQEGVVVLIDVGRKGNTSTINVTRALAFARIRGFEDFGTVILTDGSQPYPLHYGVALDNVTLEDGQAVVIELIKQAPQTTTAPQPEPECIFNDTYSIHECIPILERVDCHPDPGLTFERCAARGCIWDLSEHRPNIRNIPRCYYSRYYGYKVDKKVDDFTVELSRNEGTKSPFIAPDGVDDDRVVRATYEFYGDNILHVKLTDANDPQRYEVDARFGGPVLLWPREGRPKVQNVSATLKLEMNVDPYHGTFSFIVTRKGAHYAVLFDTSLGGLTFSNQFLQIATWLPSRHIYGFGENSHDTFHHLLRSYKTWPMFARDEAPNPGEFEERQNLYGVHPFFMGVEENGDAFGVVFINSNAQEYTTTPAPGLVYRTIGGVLDMYLFAGPRPEDVVAQYWDLIGHPTMPPYWALGFQLSRYGYKNLDEVRQVVERTRAAHIPHDVQYFDIDYMDRFLDFTYDATNFAGMPDFIRDEHAKGLRFIVIIDPAISVAFGNDYTPTATAADLGLFVSWPDASYVPEINQNYSLTKGKDYMLGVVWPDEHVAFPDFFRTADAHAWWQRCISELYTNQSIAFDGFWIDMNEPASFGTNLEHPWYFDDPVKPNIVPLRCPDGPKELWDSPPYPTYAVFGDELRNSTEKPYRLSAKTLCMNAVHKGSENQTYRHYDVHSLYGLAEAKLTQRALDAILKKRSIVVSRSTFPTHGLYGGHWLGDNTATWHSMRRSIVGMLEFNLFGVPYVGADICGFNGNTTEELCMRWTQLGAFYPMSSNHNAKDALDQDPAVFGEAFAASTREALELRYRLLPYMYTLFWEAHRFGKTVARPTFFEFPVPEEGGAILRLVEGQFMLGPAVLVSSVLEPNVTTFDCFFPTSADWYSIRSLDYGVQVSRLVDVHTLEAPLEKMFPVHIRGGHIVPVQRPGLNTEQSRRNPLHLLIALSRASNDSHPISRGSLFWDDGETLLPLGDSASIDFTFECYPHGCRLDVAFEARNESGAATWSLPTLDAIEVFGLEAKPDFDSFTVNNDSIVLDFHDFVNQRNKHWLHFGANHLLQLDAAAHQVLEWSTVSIPSGGVW